MKIITDFNMDLRGFPIYDLFEILQHLQPFFRFFLETQNLIFVDFRFEKYDYVFCQIKAT